MSSPLLSIEDQLALQQLNADFAYYLDHHQVTPLIALFTEQAYYRHGTRITEGRDAIETLFRQRAASGLRVARHSISGLRLQRVDEITATGCSVVVTWAADGTVPIHDAAPYLVADFNDRYSKEVDGIWRIERREISRIFVARNNTGPIGNNS